MLEKSYKVVDEAGLHARPASLLVQTAGKFSDKIDIVYKEKRLTLKSIMAVMSLGIPQHGEFTIEVTGEHEAEAHAAMKKILVDHGII
jgi:phosphocarrier protein